MYPHLASKDSSGRRRDKPDASEVESNTKGPPPDTHPQPSGDTRPGKRRGAHASGCTLNAPAARGGGLFCLLAVERTPRTPGGGRRITLWGNGLGKAT